MLFAYILGNLGKDAETRFTSTGQKVTTFNVATNVRKGKEDVTVWVRVTIWGDRLSEKMLACLKKGTGVVVSGQLSYSTYLDKEGRTQVSMELTGETVNFNPFGKADRMQEANMQSNPSNNVANASNDFTATSANYNIENHARSNTNYGAHAAQGSNYSHDINEDNLPF